MLGPWIFYKLNPSTVLDMKINEKEKNHSFDMALCDVSDIKLKLIEPHDSKNIFSKHLSQFGEGIHHICFKTDNIEEIIKFFKDRGIKILQSGNWQGKKYAFFSTKNDLKFNSCFNE